MKTYIVIAAYNEEKKISNVIKDIKKQGYNNVVVVDDGSKDKTYKIAKKENIIVLKHIINLGKGAAIKTGCDYAIKKGAKILILIDADGQHEPKEIPRFIKALQNVDIVFGYRKFNKNMPKILKIGNLGLNLFTKLLFKINLRDTQSGYKAIKTKIYKKIKWTSNNYSMETEIIAKVGENKLRYSQIPIKTIYLDKSKGTTIRDGIKILKNMIKWKIKI